MALACDGTDRPYRWNRLSHVQWIDGVENNGFDMCQHGLLPFFSLHHHSMAHMTAATEGYISLAMLSHWHQLPFAPTLTFNAPCARFGLTPRFNYQHSSHQASLHFIRIISSHRHASFRQWQAVCSQDFDRLPCLTLHGQELPRCLWRRNRCQTPSVGLIPLLVLCNAMSTSLTPLSIQQDRTRASQRHHGTLHSSPGSSWRSQAHQ
jgi:hypothetical protein